MSAKTSLFRCIAASLVSQTCSRCTLALQPLLIESVCAALAERTYIAEFVPQLCDVQCQKFCHGPSIPVP